MNILEVIDKSKPINLVLSGGGVKGVAHIALLEYLEIHEIKLNAISASSAGALVGALYASGKKPAEILDFFKATPIFRYTWLNPRKAGVFDSERYAQIMTAFVKETFEELEIPMYITATNIEEGKPHVFNKGQMIRPLVASCAVPLVFSPMELDDVLYVDGGVMDNFPIAPFLNDNHQIIGSYAACPPPRLKSDLTSILKVSSHSNALLLYSANEYKFKLTSHTVNYPIGIYGIFDSKSIDSIYTEAKEYLLSLGLEGE
jgi:NTE family protein